MSKRFPTYTQKFEIDTTTITIEHFYDIDFNSFRYSYQIKRIGGLYISAGYGRNNEVVYPTLESISNKIFKELPISVGREFKMKLLGI